MLNSNVLVLNRSFLPIHVTSVRRAFSLVYSGTASVVDEQYQTFDFASWAARPAAASDEQIGTTSGALQVPRVIVLCLFDRFPRRHVRYSRANVFTRDDFTCQYCGERPPRSQLNLDHVVPRAQGGRTSWENVVASCVNCNRRKGGRTPEQAKLRLQRRPERPRWTPLLGAAPAGPRYREWQPFLGHYGSSRKSRRREAAGEVDRAH
jgi:5-methylcytosine-specific restriction endonuclease McrA